jgi:hypothetical protein
MDRVVRYDTRGFVVIFASGVHVAIEAGEVTARDFDPYTVACWEVVTCGHR